MLSREDNELLCRVGAGTPMGNLFRQYWLPALLASELPTPGNGDPVRLMLLGEKLIAFRDTTGQVGLIQNHCPHRGASLFFGRTEEAGLRCVYHGWKFDVSGRCVDMPNEPAESDFKAKVKAVAYPCVERGGLIWTYMGPRENPPPLPDIEANMLPEGQSVVRAVQRECNWVQTLEGDIDTAHSVLLHAGMDDYTQQDPGSFLYYLLRGRSMRFAAVDTEYGTLYGAYKPADDDTNYWRIGSFLLPCFTMTPTGVLGLDVNWGARVPMDDGHTLNFSQSSTEYLSWAMADRAKRGGGRRSNSAELLPNTSDWYGRFRLAANSRNDYQIDRQVQKNTSYTGMFNAVTEDTMVTETMGPIYDRTQERLGTTDLMIIKTRRRLMDAARALQERGATPPGVDDPEVYRVRTGQAFLPRTADWVEATADLRKGFVRHPELSRSGV